MRYFFYVKKIRAKYMLLFAFIYMLMTAVVYGKAPKDYEEQKNFASFFLGGTEFEQKHAFTYALEYYRTIVFPVGISLEYERVPRNDEGNSEYELFSVAVVHLPNKIYVAAGPGLKNTKEKHNTLLGRFSAGYIFSLPSDMEFVPNINVDLVNRQHQELIYGVSMGKRF